MSLGQPSKIRIPSIIANNSLIILKKIIIGGPFAVPIYQ